MPAPMVKTKHPGIYKRGSRYVVVYKLDGRQRKESARTLDGARRLRADRLAARNRGELDGLAASDRPFADYAREWVERYPKVRESTRENYRRDLERYAIPFLGTKPLRSITGEDLARMVAWLQDERRQAQHHNRLRVNAGKKPSDATTRALSDSTIANAIKAVRAALKAAHKEGLIRTNPALNVDLPERERIVQDDDPDADCRAFTREQLGTILQVAHPKHRDLFTLLATTGLRISEALALEWRHLELELAPRVKVRQQHYRGRTSPPKTKRGRRDVPIPPSLAATLRRRYRDAEWNGPEDLVFANEVGQPQHVENLRRRYLRPALSEAGASWAGFHTFRHTFSSLKLEGGAPVVEVSAMLGHASPRITLDVYSHWLKSDDPEPLDLAAELAQGGNKVATQATGTGRNAETVESLETAI